MNPILVALLLVCLASLAEAHASQSPPRPPLVLAEGQRVRTTLLAREQRRLVGTLFALRPDSLGITAEPDSSDTTIARLDIRKLEIYDGRHSSAGTGAKIGAITGGVFFALVGVAIAQMSESENPPDPTLSGVTGGILGAVTVGAVGALIGSAFHHDRWEEVKKK